MPEYFLTLVVILIFTVVAHKWSGVKIYSNWQHGVVFNAFNLILATIWDQWAIARGHWIFTEKYLLGIKIGRMPIEEFLFVSVLMYFNVVFYRIFEEKFGKSG